MNRPDSLEGEFSRQWLLREGDLHPLRADRRRGDARVTPGNARREPYCTGDGEGRFGTDDSGS